MEPDVVVSNYNPGRLRQGDCHKFKTNLDYKTTTTTTTKTVWKQVIFIDLEI